MISVALPIWNNRVIAWLPMEGLCRQITNVEWELLVMECISPDILGEDYFRQWEGRLKDAGCNRIKYIYSDTRLPLSRKWKIMGGKARGKYFCLQGSDDYPHPERNQSVWDNRADWYDINKYYHFDVNKKKVILYDNKGTCTGFNMAVRTKLLGRLPKNDVSRYVDGYMIQNIQPSSISKDKNIYCGISTNGVNTISIKRGDYYDNPIPPFYATDKTLFDIGLPDEISNRLWTLM